MTKNESASSKVVLDINADLLDKGYNIFIDNWYSSPDLYLKLHAKKKMLLDTVRNNRKNMPNEFGKNQLKAMKLKKGDVIFRSCDKGLIAIIWKDKNYVRMLSTMHTSGMKDTGKKERNGDPRLKPQCVLTYNDGMGGVDASDQMAATYRFVRKYVKWSKKLLFYLLDIVVLNSFYLWLAVQRGSCSIGNE